jgi:hypothetical protein
MSDRTLRVFWNENISPETLETVLRDERLQWIYSERMEDVHLDWLVDLLDGETNVPLDRLDTGRAFGMTLEVDWWREAEGYRVRALLEAGDPPTDVAWTEVASPTLVCSPENEHPLLLWGTYDEELGSWAEARIPRPLSYPTRWDSSTPPERVVLRVCDYHRDGAVVMTRFLCVEPYSEG